MPDEPLPLGYNVYNSTLHAWLGDDEQRFTVTYAEAAEFADFETAEGIMHRAQRAHLDDTLYVMAVMPLLD
jgi:hypothetical protein